MNVLLIGGAGFIGSVLKKRLRAEGATVTLLDIQSRPEDEGDDYVQMDVRDRDGIAPHFLSRDLVINLAAQHRDDVRPVSLYDEVNVDGARNICAAAAAAGVKRQIFTSSVAIYGEHDGALTETTEAKYFNDYGRTKWLAEAVYRQWRDAAPDRILKIVRPTVVFGPGNRGNVYTLLRQIRHGPFLMVGDGENVKSIAHVENVAGFLTFLSKDGGGSEVYNYADGPDLTINELVALVQEALGREPRPPAVRLSRPVGLVLGGLADVAARLLNRSLPLSAVRVRKFCAQSKVDASRARASGYEPVCDLRTGLAAMVRDHV